MRNALIICEEGSRDRVYGAVHATYSYPIIELAYNYGDGLRALKKERRAEDHLSLVVIKPELRTTPWEIAEGMRLIRNPSYLQFLTDSYLVGKCSGVSLVGLIGVGARVVVDASGLTAIDADPIGRCLVQSGLDYRMVQPDMPDSLRELVSEITPRKGSVKSHQ